MNWCRYHGILTPATYSGGPTGKLCGYLTNPPFQFSACTSPVYNIDVFEIDQMVEKGLPDRLVMETCSRCKKEKPKTEVHLRGRGGYKLCTPCDKKINPWYYGE